MGGHEAWATEAEARTLRLVADTRAAEVASALADHDQRSAHIRDLREVAMTTVNRVFDAVEDQLRSERTGILVDDLAATRLELDAVKAEIKAEKLHKNREVMGG